MKSRAIVVKVEIGKKESTRKKASLSKDGRASVKGRKGKRGNWKPRWDRSDSEATAAPTLNNKDDFFRTGERVKETECV